MEKFIILEKNAKQYLPNLNHTQTVQTSAKHSLHHILERKKKSIVNDEYLIQYLYQAYGIHPSQVPTFPTYLKSG